MIPWAHHIYRSLSRRDYEEPWLSSLALRSKKIKSREKSRDARQSRRLNLNVESGLLSNRIYYIRAVEFSIRK